MSVTGLRGKSIATGAFLIRGAFLSLGVTIAIAATAAEPSKGLDNPFFAYSVNVPEQVLKELGYTPLRNLYVGIHLDKQPAYSPELESQIRKLKGTNTIFWLTVHGNRTRDSDAKAVELIRRLAAVADESAVKIALYPHTGFYVATARDALRIVKAVDRKSVGVTVNLCHELMQDNGDQLPQILEEAAPHLLVVTVNGADRKAKGQAIGWDRIIQPLGKGDFDTYGFLKKVKAIGFQGPIGLQCYGLKGEPRVHLAQSIKAWQEYRRRLAAEK